MTATDTRAQEDGQRHVERAFLNHDPVRTGLRGRAQTGLRCASSGPAMLRIYDRDRLRHDADPRRGVRDALLHDRSLACTPPSSKPERFQLAPWSRVAVMCRTMLAVLLHCDSAAAFPRTFWTVALIIFSGTAPSTCSTISPFTKNICMGMLMIPYR